MSGASLGASNDKMDGCIIAVNVIAPLDMPGVLEKTSTTRPMENAHNNVGTRCYTKGMYNRNETYTMGVPRPQNCMWLSNST